MKIWKHKDSYWLYGFDYNKYRVASLCVFLKAQYNTDTQSHEAHMCSCGLCVNPRWKGRHGGRDGWHAVLFSLRAVSKGFAIWGRGERPQLVCHTERFFNRPLCKLYNAQRHPRPVNTVSEIIECSPM